jgi:thiol-disulfide isomerase/thioredoxin
MSNSRKNRDLSARRRKMIQKGVPWGYVLPILVIVIVVGALFAFIVFSQHGGGCGGSVIQVPAESPEPQIGQVISQRLYQNLTGVSDTTLSSVGLGCGASSPSPISGSSLQSNGKPMILYIGAEYCPFCASERWSLAVALSKFGNFSNLTYMLSSSTDTDPNTPTFSFLNSSYVSQYISFVSVEYQDRNRNALQTVNASEQALWNKYSGGSIPFVDIANNYTVVSAQYSPTLLANLDWSQVGSQLDNSNSSIARAIEGAANTLISAICKVDGGKPSSVCTQSYAQLSLALLPMSSSMLAVSTCDSLTRCAKDRVVQGFR